MKDTKATKATTAAAVAKAGGRTLKEVADAIDAHLRRFERDKKINRVDPKYKTSSYYGAGAHASGGRVGVQYVAYQATRYLSNGAALAYLAWLDAGHVGTHFESVKAHEEGVAKDANWVKAWGASKDYVAGIRGPSQVWVVDEGRRWKTRDRPEAVGYKEFVRKDDASKFVSTVMEATVEKVRQWLLVEVASTEESLKDLRERLDALDAPSLPSLKKAKKARKGA